ncbi:hypothetical protein FAI41_01615 [Acetobacteraceae bacterium]|nr:hypothetical protein FAI41_01615 [Acetobacteraceae bacterium]
MFLECPFFSSSFFKFFLFILFVLAFIVLPIRVKAQNCQGKILHSLEIRPFGRQGDVYHYRQGEIIPDVRAHRASFFGKPSYYLSKGIGPLPAKEIELLNCHPVFHPSEGFFDPGYDLIPNEWAHKDINDSDGIPYQKPTKIEK